jgi:uncharacterized protein (DUF1697 family)
MFPTEPLAWIGGSGSQGGIPMPLVVFMRAVNVGGHKTFQPSTLAKELAHLDAVNVGTAGTFVVRKAPSQRQLRAEIKQRLPFDVEFMILLGADLLDLMENDPFAKETLGEDVKPYVSILEKGPQSSPILPIHQPAGDAWQVRLFAVTGRFALSLHQRQGRTLVYPNEVVEKHLGVSATTRNWNTISTLCDILKGKK